MTLKKNLELWILGVRPIEPASWLFPLAHSLCVLGCEPTTVRSMASTAHNGFWQSIGLHNIIHLRKGKQTWPQLDLVCPSKLEVEAKHIILTKPKHQFFVMSQKLNVLFIIIFVSPPPLDPRLRYFNHWRKKYPPCFKLTLQHKKSTHTVTVKTKTEVWSKNRPTVYTVYTIWVPSRGLHWGVQNPKRPDGRCRGKQALPETQKPIQSQRPQPKTLQTRTTSKERVELQEKLLLILAWLTLLTFMTLAYLDSRNDSL